MFLLIRMLLSFIIIAVVILILVRRKIKLTGKKLIILLIGIIGFYCLSFMLPFENLIISFSDPESAFRYWNTGEITQVINGEDSTVIEYTPGEGVTSLSVLPIVNSRWKLPSMAATVKFIPLRDSSVIHVLTYCKLWRSKEVFIFLDEVMLDGGVSRLAITDNYGSSFRQYLVMENDYYNITHYAIVKIKDSNYELTIDGVTYPIRIR